MDETTLIRETQQGSLVAYEQLMEIYMHRIRALLSTRAPVTELIDKIAQDTFIFAYDHIQEFKLGTAFFAWLSAIAKNLLRSEIKTFVREQSRRKKYEVHIQAIQACHDVDDSEDFIGHLQECVKYLPETQTKLIQLKYYQKQSTNEMAVTLEKSLSWVRTNLFRVRGGLKNCIDSKRKAEL